ncbi:MAG: hypothetical protein QOK43_3188 [Acidimicrobiaceae bacterium]|nr:hypothetical protein [Acidimicrobiaceae bacterium]
MLTAAALGAGFVCTAVASRFGGRFGPVLLIALALAPAVFIAAVVRPWLGIAYVFASIPVGSTGLPKVPMQVVQGMIVLAVVVLLISRVAEGRIPLEWTTSLWWFLGFVMWAVVALPSAADNALAVRQTLLFAGELVFAAVVVTACDTPAKVRRAVGALLVVASGIAVTAPIGMGQVSSQFGGSVVSGRAQGVFHQPNELGTFCAVAVLAAVGMALGGATRRSRRTAAFATVLLTVPLLLSLSRGAWIGVTFGLLALSVMLPEARRMLLSIGIPVVLLAVLIGSFAPSSPEVQVVSERAKSIVGERNPYDDRPHIWAEGKREFLADPWTGQGPGSFPVVAARSGSETVTFYPEHAHNLLLTFGAEIGLPGVLFALGFFAAVTVSVRRALRRARAAGRTRDAALLAGLAAAMVAIVGQGILDYALRSAVIFTTVTGALGALLALARAINTSSAVPRPVPVE